MGRRGAVKPFQAETSLSVSGISGPAGVGEWLAAMGTGFVYPQW